MFCPNCGAKLEDTAKFCMRCGTAIGGVSASPPAPSPSPPPVSAPPLAPAMWPAQAYPPPTAPTAYGGPPPYAPPPAPAYPPPYAPTAPPFSMAGTSRGTLNIVGFVFIVLAIIASLVATGLSWDEAFEWAAGIYLLSAFLFIIAGIFFWMARRAAATPLPPPGAYPPR